MTGIVLCLGQSVPALEGEDLLKSDILAVFAHPDDETGMASTLAHYAHIGNKRIVNVYCTRGEGGGNMVGRHWGPALGILRESELRQCLTILGVERAYFLDQRDWAYTESAQMTLRKWDREKALEKLTRLIRATRPEILMTMNPTPNPGQHGHHQAAGILAIEAFHHAGNPQSFPDQIVKEGLNPWFPRKVYIGSSPEPFGATIQATAETEEGQSIASITGLALSHHRSQGFGRMKNAPWLKAPRSYKLLLSSVGFKKLETDLFRGISSPGNETKPLPIPESAQTSTPDHHPRIQDRPAMERFRSWAEKYQVASLIPPSKVNLSFPAGMDSAINIILPPNATKGTDTIDWQLPTGWNISLPVDHQSPGIMSFQLTIPPDHGMGDHPVSFKYDEVSLNATVNVLPHISIKKSTPHAGDDFWPDWNSTTSLAIPHTHRWQGSPESDRDISAVAQIGFNQNYLFVRTIVTDNHVITNIEPNDAKGHWRSDSVEICLDPSGGSEHTLNCFKAGIFPFTIGGGVAGSRDADANQGPLDLTAPGTILTSRKTESGYIIDSAIPWKHTGISPTPSQQFGFNLLIYDGDKSDAAPGENIGKSRLAWAPRSGVQGRPEDWGRITIMPNFK